MTSADETCEYLAESFLLGQRNRQGWWVDFRLAPGFSDEWVTAYVGTVLAAIPSARAQEAARTAWDLLQTRVRPGRAWGYNGLTPDDADSTAWGIILADAVGAGEWAHLQRVRCRLEQHLDSSGGIATYAEDDPIRRFIGAPMDRSFRGWRGPQPCVTAAVAAIPDFGPRVRDYLLQTQQDDGRWKSYWWCEDEYATALAAEALARSGRSEDVTRVERAARWAERRVESGFVATDDHPNGSPFATAWCLRTLLLAQELPGARDAAIRAASWLRRQQREDGSWQPSARLRVPLPEDEHPDMYTGWISHGLIEGSIVFDGWGAFTTATVLRALHQVTSSESRSPSENRSE